MHNPRRIGQSLSKLRHVAAVDDDQLGPELGGFAPDRAVQSRLIQRGDRKRRAGEKRPQRAQLDRQAADRGCRNALRTPSKPGNIGEVLFAVAEAEHMHFVAPGEVADRVERGNLVATVGRKRNAAAYIEDSHCRPAACGLFPLANQGPTWISAMEVSPPARSVTRSFQTPVLSFRARGSGCTAIPR